MVQFCRFEKVPHANATAPDVASMAGPMPIVRVDDPEDPRLADYRTVPDPVLLRERGLFVAESRLVVRELLAHPHLRTRSLLVTAAALASLRDLITQRPDDLPIYVGTPQILRHIVGFQVHRGCLGVGERTVRATDATLPGLASARLVVVLERVGNPDNVGGIFRNAAAFGAAGVLLNPTCCDPLYRKAIRVSIGATLRVPFGAIDDWPDGLSRLRVQGFTIAALTPAPDAEDIEHFVADLPPRIALLLGTEGPGLSATASALAHRRVRIPIAPGVDSLNVATAAGIALHRIASATTRRDADT